MDATSTTHRHNMTCPETAEHADYQGKHHDESPTGIREATYLDSVTRRFPDHPIAQYVGKRRHDVGSRWFPEATS